MGVISYLFWSMWNYFILINTWKYIYILIARTLKWVSLKIFFHFLLQFVFYQLKMHTFLNLAVLKHPI